MQEKKFFGHPRQLGNLFHIELWERFSYYGMQAILMIYLYFSLADGGLGLDKAVAGGIVGAYSGSIYLATLGGGWVADRVLGAERTLFYSGIIIMMGHILLALVSGLQGLVLGLVLIAIGSGGVKAPVSSMVGSLYENDEYRPLRDAGFSLFYVSINIGGLLGPLLTGYLQSTKGFHYGFGVAAIGMVFGLLQYSFGRKHLSHKTAINPLTQKEATVATTAVLGGIVLIAGAVFAKFLTLANFKKVLFVVVIAVAMVYFARLLMDKRTTSQNKRHILAYIPLFVCVCIFWAIWMQNYTLLVVYFESSVNRMLGSFEVPIAWQASMQSFWVVALAGVMSALWTKMGNKAPKTPTKFAMSLFFVALTFCIFLPYVKTNSPMPMVVYALSLGVITIAELFISPISLSFATRIAPAFFKTQMVALNFLALSIGLTLGGNLFAEFFQEDNPIGFYYLLIALGAVSGVGFVLIAPILSRMLKEVE